MDKQVAVVLLVALVISFAGPACAGNVGQNATSEQELEKLNNMVPKHNSWAVTLNVRRLDKFLDYKGARLSPVVQVKASLAIRDDQSKNFDQTKLYEVFLFHKKTALGVSRKMAFSVPNNSQGTIIIDESADAERETSALCNAMLRILLDAHISGAAVSVIAPESLCSPFEESLSSFRFREVSNVSADQRGIMLHVFTETRNFDHYYLFEN